MASGKRYFGFKQNVFVLSVISFLNDIGGETIKRVIPLFLTNVLEVGTTLVGVVDGVANATPQLWQPISGWLSDRQVKRRPYVLLGQLLRSAMLLLALVTQWWQVLLLRFIDRSGKGIQDAPRDALLSLSARAEEQGRVFGLNRAFDYAGAVIGLSGAGTLLYLFSRNPHLLNRTAFTTIVFFAALPLVVAFFLAIFAVREADNTKAADGQTGPNEQFKDLALPKKYWFFLAFNFIFAAGNSSDGFVLLRGQNIGLELYKIFFVFAGFSLVTAATSYPLARFSDTHSRKRILAIGWLIYTFVYFGLARVSGLPGYISLLAVYGVYYGFTEGVGKALTSDLLKKSHKGVGFGIYNLVVGGTLLPASVFAGFLWEVFSPAMPFYFGSATALIASLGLLVFL